MAGEESERGGRSTNIESKMVLVSFGDSIGWMKDGWACPKFITLTFSSH